MLSLNGATYVILILSWSLFITSTLFFFLTLNIFSSSGLGMHGCWGSIFQTTNYYFDNHHNNLYFLPVQWATMIHLPITKMIF